MPSPQQVMELLPRDCPVTDSPGRDRTRSIIAGFAILAFILLLCTICSLAIPGGGKGTVVSDPGLTASPPQGEDPLPATLPVTSSGPAVTPVIISSTPLPRAVATLSPAPRSYVTIEPVPVTNAPVHQDLRETVPVRKMTEYITIYSLDGQKAQQNLPYVSFFLANPPLIIDFTVNPTIISDLKEEDYKILSTAYHENLTINRPYEHAWFRVVVRDRDSGRIVLESGYGKTYGQTESGQIILYKGGNYRFEFTGDYATVDLTMRVEKEGNIE
jgi:hypothetical protein